MRWLGGAFVGLILLALAGCGGGGGSSSAPSRVAIENCLGHAGGSVSAQERKAEIGGLPALMEITLRERGSAQGEVYIGLFETSGEADEARSILEEVVEQKEPAAAVKTFADGTVVGVTYGGSGRSRREAILGECAGGDDGAVVAVEEDEDAELAAEEKAESDELTTAGEAVVACLEKAGIASEVAAQSGYAEVAGTAKDGGAIAILVYNDEGQAVRSVGDLKRRLKEEHPGSLVVASLAGQDAVVATAGAGGGSPLAAESDEVAARACAVRG